MSNFYHVVENGVRDGKQVYVLVKTYKRWAALMRWLMRPEVKPCWVVETAENRLVADANGEVGGDGKGRYLWVRSWNWGSGWGAYFGELRGQMPKLPLAAK